MSPEKFTHRDSRRRTRAIEIPASRPAAPASEGGYRVAFLVYRGNPTCGGQGVYARHLTRELVRLGHSVEVFSGQPWPELDDGVGFTPIVGLDLYRSPDPFRRPALAEFRSWADVVEYVTTLTGGFGEPRAFGMRIRRVLRSRRGDFDLLHDNQTLADGIWKLHREGWPLLQTLHHPITVDRRISVAHADTWWKRYGARRWYGFLRMQRRVAAKVPAIVTVSHNSREDIATEMGADLRRITVVPVGVDHEIFRPQPNVAKVTGRLMVTTSSDVPMKGLVPLLEAVAELRRERPLELMVIGRPKAGGRVDEALSRLGLTDVVQFVSGVSDEELARLYATAEVAVVPSLYEGFSLPAIEAMACAVPLLATTGGAIPEVVGRSGETGILVEPNSPGALVTALRTLLNDPVLRATLGERGRQRVLERFTWEVTARGTAACYDAILRGSPLPEAMSFS